MNKVFSVSGASTGSTSKESLEVYRDISMSAGNGNNGKYKIENNVNVLAVQNSLNNIFSWFVGERVLDPEFGNRLYQYLYDGITEYNMEKIVAEIRNMVSKYEPRVRIIEIVPVLTTEDTSDNTAAVDVVYSIEGITDKKYNYRYAPDLPS